MEYFNYLVNLAREEAQTAMTKFPQPNYVLNKLSEEHGEVVKAVIHFTEGRESWPNVEKEIVQNLAMLIRLVTEGDQVIGFTPPKPSMPYVDLSVIPPELKSGAVYRHQNGYEYEIIDTGLDNSVLIETAVVVHKGTHDGRVWVRSLSSFLGLLRGKPRFELIRPAPGSLNDEIPVDPKIVARNMLIEKAEALRTSGKLEPYAERFMGFRWNWDLVKRGIGYDRLEPITAENFNVFCLMCKGLRDSLPFNKNIRSGPYYEVCGFAEEFCFGD